MAPVNRKRALPTKGLGIDAVVRFSFADRSARSTNTRELLAAGQWVMMARVRRSAPLEDDCDLRIASVDVTELVTSRNDCEHYDERFHQLQAFVRR